MGIIWRIHCIWCLGWNAGIGEGELDLLLSMGFSKWLTWTSWQNCSISLTGFLTRQLVCLISIPGDMGWSCKASYDTLLKGHAVSLLPMPFESNIGILNLVHLIDFWKFFFFFFFYKLKLYDKPVLKKSISAIFFPTAFSHFLSRCHILVIFPIFQAF